MPNPGVAPVAASSGSGMAGALPAGLQAVGDIAGTVLGAFSKGGIFGEDAVTKEDVKNSFSWRIAAGRKQGISPLVSLGVSPLPSGGGVTLGDFGQMGADIGRAASALMSKPDRVQDLLLAQQLKKGEAEINLINAQTAKLLQPGNGPGVGNGTGVNPNSGLTYLGHKLPARGQGVENWMGNNPVEWLISTAGAATDIFNISFDEAVKWLRASPSAAGVVNWLKANARRSGGSGGAFSWPMN